METKTPATKKLITCHATRLNVLVLARLAGGRREFSNAVQKVDAPHLRRCLQAGLVEVRGSLLVVTEAGRVAIGDAHVSNPYITIIPVL